MVSHYVKSFYINTVPRAQQNHRRAGHLVTVSAPIRRLAKMFF